MSDEIEIRNGQASMMYAGETPWHKLGTKVETEQTAAAAIKLGGLDWLNVLQSIYLKGQKEIDGIPIIGNEITEKKAVVRTLDNKVLGIVGNRYNIIQNKDCFNFLDEVVGSGQAIYHTVGSLFGGKVIFVTLKLPTDAKVGDDKIHKYVLLTSSHDGTSSVHVKWTPVRVVCANTLNMSLQGMTNQKISIRHTSNYIQKIAEARKVLELTDYYYQVMEKEFNQLLETTYTEGQMVDLTKKLFPTNSTRSQHQCDNLVNLYHNGIGIGPVGQTKWAAFNAVVEYADYHTIVRNTKNRTVGDAKASSVLFGSAAALKQRAYNLLTV